MENIGPRVPELLTALFQTTTVSVYRLKPIDRTGLHVYCVSRNEVPSLTCYNFDICERILTIFGRNVTDKVSNQKTLHTPPQITCTSALPGKIGKHKNHFSLKCCISAFNRLLDFFNLFDSRLIGHAGVWLPKSCNQCVQLGAAGGMVHDSGERKLTALQELHCVARTMHQCAVFWVSYFAR